MAKFVVFPDGQIADGKEIVAVKKITFDDDSMCIRVMLSRDLGVVDIRCSDELHQAKTLQEVVNAVLDFGKSDTVLGGIKH